MTRVLGDVKVLAVVRGSSAMQIVSCGGAAVPPMNKIPSSGLRASKRTMRCYESSVSSLLGCEVSA